MNTKILKRALEMVAWQAQKGGCEYCAKKNWCTEHICPMTDRGCSDLLITHFIRKATAEIKAKESLCKKN